jgi:hypothetical protein
MAPAHAGYALAAIKNIVYSGWRDSIPAADSGPGRPTDLPEIYAKSGCSAYTESVGSYWFDTTGGIMP